MLYLSRVGVECIILVEESRGEEHWRGSFVMGCSRNIVVVNYAAQVGRGSGRMNCFEARVTAAKGERSQVPQ